MRETVLYSSAVTAVRLILLAALFAGPASAQGEVQIARVHYGGGGDWYSGDPLPTLAAFARQHTLLDVDPEPITVELTSDRLFTVPVLFLNGHGNVVFTDAEAARLRRYLEGGGFLIVNDDYGLDESIRRELAKVFPEQALQPLPASHPVYHSHFSFPDGLPKIHAHDDEPAQGFGCSTRGGWSCSTPTRATSPTAGSRPASTRTRRPCARPRSGWASTC